MDVIIVPEKEIGELVADKIASLLTENPKLVLGLATGTSPLQVYDSLASRVQLKEMSFAHARGFTLDEYVGLPANHPCSYRTAIDQEFVARVDFAPGAVKSPDGTAVDLVSEAAAYDRSITEAGGIDFQILGIGTDGHIAFNEPGSSLSSRTRVKTLTQQTRTDNARFFGGDVDAVPKHCLTQGLGTIMQARHIVLIATGVGKAEAVHQLIEGPVSALWPATILQHHPHVTVLIDDAAASKLQLAGYFRYVHAHRSEVH